MGTGGKSRRGGIHAGGQTKAHDAHWDFPVLAERSQGQLLHVRKNYAVFWVLSTTDDNKLTQFQQATRKTPHFRRIIVWIHKSQSRGTIVTSRSR